MIAETLDSKGFLERENRFNPYRAHHLFSGEALRDKGFRGLSKNDNLGPTAL